MQLADIGGNRTYMSWFSKLLPTSIRINSRPKRSVPEGLWVNCPECKSVLYREELTRNLEVCVKCGHHMRISARDRLERFLDEDNRQELGDAIKPHDFLKFRDGRRYRDRLNDSQKSTGETEALVAIQGELAGMPVVACAFEFSFMGGSMGSVVGEKLMIAADTARTERLPFICFAASGGARMQEGLTSLMQMSKTSAAVGRLRQAGIPYISVLTDPTMGGVSASIAMLGDIIVAEPNALIGFAGPRVIEQTVKQVLPEGFQRAEFLLEHGAIDRIVNRNEMRDEIAAMIAILTRRPPLQSLERAAAPLSPSPDENGSNDEASPRGATTNSEPAASEVETASTESD